MPRSCQPLRSRPPRSTRRGAIAALVAVLLPVLLVMVGFGINVAYMELTRTQLRISCDAAAKAALVNFGATQQQASACALGQSVSAANPVGGQPLVIPSGNFVFGNAAKNPLTGVYTFTPGLAPMNSVQVTGAITLPHLFASFLPSASFTLDQVSVTSRVSHDIVLVLDRSASMAFDLSNNEFSYPSDRSTFTQLQNYFTPPSPTGSRWYELTQAVNLFIGVLQSRNLDAHVALVTYAENYALGNYSATEASLDVPLSGVYSLIPAAMDVWGQKPLLGDTNISAGLAMAQAELTGPLARVTANRTIILLTDGVATTGNLDIPGLTLSDRTGSEIITHVITFGGEASTGSVATSMQGAAQNGNGMYFNAPTAAQLQQAFQEIADSLPAVLIN